MTRLRALLAAAAVFAVACNAMTGIGDLAVGSNDAGSPAADSSPGTDATTPPVEMTDAAVDAAEADAAEAGDGAVEADAARPLPSSCADALKQNPGAPSARFTIDPDGSGENPAYQVFCDMKTAGGGWTETFRWTSY